jgi:hypothetical protein
MLKHIVRLGVLCAVLTPAAAFASTIVWKDPVEGFTMAYPDSWTVQTPDTPITKLRVAGPLGEDLPTCRMKVMHDGRAKIYPKGYVNKAVSHDLDRDWWEGEAAQYEDARITDFYDPASLGNKGDATAIRVMFRMSDGKNMVPMYGVMIASIYGEKRYVASCASKAEVYEKWAPVFAEVLDSVDLDSRYHPFATGYYRNFLMDPKLHLPRSKPGTAYDGGRGMFGGIFIDPYHK